jgi:hypothetical protein
MIIDHFKAWMPQATNVLKHTLEQQARNEEQQRREQLQREKAAEEQRLRINKALRV